MWGPYGSCWALLVLKFIFLATWVKSGFGFTYGSGQQRKKKEWDFCCPHAWNFSCGTSWAVCLCGHINHLFIVFPPGKGSKNHSLYHWWTPHGVAVVWSNGRDCPACMILLTNGSPVPIFLDDAGTQPHFIRPILKFQIHNTTPKHHLIRHCNFKCKTSGR